MHGVVGWIKINHLLLKSNTIDDSTYASIDRDCWTAYRYATKVEIEKYKIDRKEYKDMEIEKTTLYNDYQEKRQVLIKKMESIIK